MPELPEVDFFRHLLEPLVSPSSTPSTLKITTPSPTPPRKFPAQAELNILSRSSVAAVQRKGKLLCLVLRPVGFCFLHMGMTGRISTPNCIVKLESLRNDETWPPPHTHLILEANGHRVSYSDPRRFGHVTYATKMDVFEAMAPDCLSEGASLASLARQKKGVKGLLLDQKKAVSGVGNWVADEVLFQSEIHPDQPFLDDKEIVRMESALQQILTVAVRCLRSSKEFPAEWLFHRRWSKKKAGAVRDAQGRMVKFVESGGRSSAIVPDVQRLQKRAAPTKTKTTHKEKKRTVENPKNEGAKGASAKRQGGRTKKKPARKRRAL